MEHVPIYDELHIVSDLHLGGVEGFQIFDQGETFARLVDSLRGILRAKRKISPSSKVCLLINGDLVDFLAEPGAVAFDPAGAVGKLKRILGDEAFAPVARALREFVATPNRRLVITLGNHDLELALPWVREHLLEDLSQGNDAARGRITLAFDGVGFRCRVGKANILCVHGNEVDPWNVTDFETLRRQGRDSFRGLGGSPDWVPNAGTQLVVKVMNDVKREFPFVDLLKPEAEAVLPTLIALKPKLMAKIPSLFPAALRRDAARIRMATGLLGSGRSPSGEPPAEFAEPDDSPPQFLAETFAFSESDERQIDVEHLLNLTEERLLRNEQPIDLLSRGKWEDFLGNWNAAWNLVTRKGTAEALREALSTLKKDRSFQLDGPDPTCDRLDRLVGTEIHFLVAGHTHLERALRRFISKSFYYNTGTWVRLMGFSEAHLGSEETFREVFNALKAGTMAALDQVPGLVLRKPAVVSIRQQGDVVYGEMSRVSAPGKDPLLELLPGSRFEMR